jgi:hypothetical protein
MLAQRRTFANTRKLYVQIKELECAHKPLFADPCTSQLSKRAAV